MTTTETTIHGSQPCQSGTAVCRGAPVTFALTAKLGSAAGFQIRRNSSVTTSAVNEDNTSVSA